MFKETGDSRYMHWKELNKACFQHDMAYGDFKDLIRRRASDKILRDKVFSIAENSKHDGLQMGFTLVFYKVFDKITFGSSIKTESISNKELAEAWHKQVISKFQKRKVHSSFTENNWCADLANTQLINEFNKEFRFLLCVI